MIIGFLVTVMGCTTLNLPSDNNSVGNTALFSRFFDDTKAKSITIEITRAEWNKLDDAMIQYHERFGNYKTDQFARANFIYDDGGEIITIKDIGFRTRGNTSRGRIQDDDKNPVMSNFKISFHEDFGLAYLRKNNERTVFEVEELDLKYSKFFDEPFNDPTYITEKFSLDLFRSFGVDAAHATLTRLYVKIGSELFDYGLYTAFEPIDKLFFERRLPKAEADGDLYKSLWQHYGPASLQLGYHRDSIGIKDESQNYRPTYDLKNNKKTSDHSALKSFISSINLNNNNQFYTYIESNFNVDSMIRLLAVGVLLGNPDDYRAMGNNYYLFQNAVTGMWTMVPYDYDHGLGQGWPGGEVFSNFTIGHDIYRWGNLNAVYLNIPGYAHPLSDKILKIPEYQLRYESYLAELIDSDNNLFSLESFLSLYESQKTLYDHTLASAMNNMPFSKRNIEWYMTNKIQDIEAQLAFYQANPTSRGN
jgi:spore coat protein H